MTSRHIMDKSLLLFPGLGLSDEMKLKPLGSKQYIPPRKIVWNLIDA